MKKVWPPRLSTMMIAALLWSTQSSWAGSTTAPNAFERFVDTLRPQALDRGITRETFDAAFAGLSPDPSVAAMTRRQPEELKTVGAYLSAQVTPARIGAGKAMLARWHGELDTIERRFGVPAAIVVAVWGLETNYGTAAGNKDVIRSLATLAAMDYRPDLYRAELLSALTLLQSGEVSRAMLRGSWAGAMGQPQFMPSSFEQYAIDGDGDGHRDIWTDRPDALASIANFLRQQGWRPDRSWGFEVKLPAGLDMSRGRAPMGDWVAAGVKRADGRPMLESGEAILLFPAGVIGPAFLVSANYEVLKTYNFSDVYVLSVGLLADAIEGGTPLVAAWPTIAPLSRADRIELEARLAAGGYTVDNRQGRISLALRDVIRAAQTHLGMVPDGNPTKALLEALPAAPEGR